MMVGTYRQHLACVAAQLNGVKRHRSMKLSSRDPQLGLASPLNYAANKSGKIKIKIKSPSKKEAGAGCKSPALASREGTGETFFLDILFHRMSEMNFHQPGNWRRHRQLVYVITPMPCEGIGEVVPIRQSLLADERTTELVSELEDQNWPLHWVQKRRLDNLTHEVCGPKNSL